MTETEGDGVADLKSRRKNPPAPQRKRPSVLVAASKRPSTGSAVGDAMQRKETLLFDPHEIQPVVPGSVLGTGAKLDDLYDVAESDFTEAIIPAGCRTATALKRWNKGDLVRKDIYAAWRRTYGTAEGDTEKADTE
jgi:hypothetical protein